MGVRFFCAIASRVSDLYKAHVFWRKVERALALHHRGEARSDGLQLTSAAATLRVEWLARPVHPWDRDLPPATVEQLFTQQCMADTNAALIRLFAEIPVLDTIELCVRRSTSRPPLLVGAVRRESLMSGDYLSIGMKLRAGGVSFRMNNLCLEEIETNVD